MTDPVDRELLARYVAGELDDAGCEVVEAHVASDTAWAEALQREAELELAMFAVAEEVAQQQTTAVRQPEPEAEPGLMEQLSSFLFRGGLGIGALVMAAVVVLMLQTPGGSAMPAYQLEALSGDVQERSEDAPRKGPVTYAEGSAVELVLRPRESWEGTPDVRILLDGSVSRDFEVSVQEGGGVEVYGVWGEDLPTPDPGPHQIDVVLSHGARTLSLVHAFEVVE